MNYSISLVQYKRFRRERRLALKVNRKSCLRYYETEDDTDGYKSNENENENERSLKETNSSGIIDDIKWMLEFNQKGLMHLILYLIHIFILVIQIIESFVYTTFPLDRDPVTNKFISYWPNFCESIHLYDLNSLGAENDILPFRLLGIISLHYLLLRLRAIYLKIETAKINKYRYKKINIVHLNSSFVNEFRFTIKEWIDFTINNSKHNCKQNEALRGESRRRLLEFNKKIRDLETIDRFYYFNQIDFISCSRDSHYLDEYIKKIKNLNNNSGQKMENQISWMQYIFSVNLPNSISYVPQPLFRVDVNYVTQIIYIFSALTITMIFVAIIYLVIITYLILYATSSHETPLEKLSQARYVIGIINLYLTIIMITFNSYDNGLLIYSVITLLSRSRKVIMLLKKESDFNRFHLIEFCKFVNRNRFTFRHRHVDKFNQKNILIKRSMSLHKSFFETNALRRSSIFEKSDRMSSILALENYNKINSILHSQETSSMSQFNKEYSNFNDALEFHETTERYRQSLNKQKLEYYNENLDYLVDLIEVLRCEFRDLQSFYSTFLNITIIFSTVGLSVALAIIINATDLTSTVLGILGGIANLLPMMVTLSIGATSEGIVSDKSSNISGPIEIISNLNLSHIQFRRIYRTILPLMVNELRLIEPKVKVRMDKSCEDLAQIENRSFVIFGNFPLTFGSLTSVSVELYLPNKTIIVQTV